MLQRDAHVSVRRNGLAISPSSFNKIVRLDIQWYSYRMQRCHKILDADLPRRLRFYTSPPRDINDLRARIVAAVETIAPLITNTVFFSFMLGVIFALKILTTHYTPAGMQYVMGFPIPSRYACWAELVLIQLLVPRASFTGHLAGILVGLAFVKGPLKNILDIIPTMLTPRQGEILKTILPSQSRDCTPSVVVETVSETSHLCWNNEIIRFKSSLTSIIIESTYLTLNMNKIWGCFKV